MKYNDVEILLVEDSMDDATLTIRALKKGGYNHKLHHVKDGAEALAFMYGQDTYASREIRKHPKVIFLDLKMPKVTGIEVLEKLKSDPAFKSIPIIMLTSSKEDPDIKKCYELGANSYIVKPVESENFSQTIKELGLYWMTRNHLSE
ncbi:MAG: response regulator [Bacteroidota bacterium]|nr:response regulator [Bacteroidota bacterium]